MNFYPRHLGDYAKDTAHLTMIEHGAYNLLLDRYYATEEGIPDDQKHRVTRARTPIEKQAVDSVLKEFFIFKDGVWIKNRVQEEIDKANKKISASKTNGKRGGRPKKNPVGSEEEPKEKPSGLLVGYENETETITQTKALQSPITNNQNNPQSEKVDSTGVTPSGVVCSRLKKLGFLDVNPFHARLLALFEAGLTPEEIIAVAEEPACKGKGFGWVLSRAEGRRRDAVAQKPWFLTASGIETKAKELGLSKPDSEAFPTFKTRVYQAAGVTDEILRAAKSDIPAGAV